MEIAFLRLNVRHKPDVRKGPAKSLDLAIARRIQCGLQFDVEGVCSDAAAVHRTENLDIADWIETEAARDAGFDQLDDARNRGLGDKIEVALGLGFAKRSLLLRTVNRRRPPAVGPQIQSQSLARPATEEP